MLHAQEELIGKLQHDIPILLSSDSESRSWRSAWESDEPAAAEREITKAIAHRPALFRRVGLPITGNNLRPG